MRDKRTVVVSAGLILLGVWVPFQMTTIEDGRGSNVEATA